MALQIKWGNRYYWPGKCVVGLNAVQKQAIKEVEHLIEKGVYEFENTPCLCGSSYKDVEIATIDRYGLKHRTVICLDCGLLRTNPRLTDKSYVHFYETLYRQLYSGWEHNNEQYYKDEFDHNWRGKQIYAFFQERGISITGKTILEIGCGVGGNLSIFEIYGGGKTIGYDYGDYIAFGRNYGLDLRYGGVKEAVSDGVEADIIIIAHVIEHFTYPDSELNLLKKVCSKNTVIYIETPGVLNIHSAYIDPLTYLQNAHTYAFSNDTLTSLMQSAGFRVDYSDEYIRMLCRATEIPEQYAKNMHHAHQVIEYLEKTEKRRYFRNMRKYSTLKLRSAVSYASKKAGVYDFLKHVKSAISKRTGKK